MATLLIPRYGNGNAVSWAPGITGMTKPGLVATVADQEAFPGTLTATGSGIQGIAQFSSFGVRLVGPRGVDSFVKTGTLVPSADGQRTTFLTKVDGIPTMLYGGWPVLGMFCMEVNRGNLVGLRAFSPLLALLMGNPGGTGFQKSGVIRKAYSKNGNSYELASLVVYSTNGSGAGLDSWPATSWLPQVTITWVPYEASANGVGALTPAFGASFNTGLQSATDFGVQLPNAIRGGTLYFSMTKTTVDTVQSWIIGDLIESDEFTGSVNAHGSLPMSMNPPYVMDNSIGLITSSGGAPTQQLLPPPRRRW